MSNVELLTIETVLKGRPQAIKTDYDGIKNERVPHNDEPRQLNTVIEKDITLSAKPQIVRRQQWRTR